MYVNVITINITHIFNFSRVKSLGAFAVSELDVVFSVYQSR